MFTVPHAHARRGETGIRESGSADPQVLWPEEPQPVQLY